MASLFLWILIHQILQSRYPHVSHLCIIGHQMKFISIIVIDDRKSQFLLRNDKFLREIQCRNLLYRRERFDDEEVHRMSMYQIPVEFHRYLEYNLNKPMVKIYELCNACLTSRCLSKDFLWLIVRDEIFMFIQIKMSSVFFTIAFQFCQDWTDF